MASEMNGRDWCIDMWKFSLKITIHHLPNEILEEILAFLDTKALHQARGVCFRWHEVSLLPRFLDNETLYIKETGLSDVSPFHKMLNSSYLGVNPVLMGASFPLRSLRVTRAKFDASKPVEQGFWNQFGPTLTSVEFRSCEMTPHCLKSALAFATGLESLTFACCTVPNGFSLQTSAGNISQLASVRKLTLFRNRSHFYELLMGSTVPQLEHFTIDDGGASLRGNSIHQFVSRNKSSLRHLTLNLIQNDNHLAISVQGLQLESITVNFNSTGRQENIGRFCDALVTQAASLKSVKIRLITLEGYQDHILHQLFETVANRFTIGALRTVTVFACNSGFSNIARLSEMMARGGFHLAKEGTGEWGPNFQFER